MTFALPLALPKPAQADLLDLSALVIEAKGNDTPNWKAVMIKSLISNAHAKLTAGNWSEAFEAAQKAASKERETKSGTVARRYLSALIQLRNKYTTHNQNNEAQKISLRKEVTDERTRGGILPDIRMPEEEAQRNTDVQRTLEIPSGAENARRVLAHNDGSQGGPCPESGEISAADSQSAEGLRPIEATPPRKDLLDAFWDAIISQSQTAIEQATQACKQADLSEVYRVVVWQLDHRDLSDGARLARVWAVTVWERREVQP